MKGLLSARGAGPAMLGVLLFAAMILLAAGTSYAERDGGRGNGGGWRAKGGGDRARAGAVQRQYKGNGGARAQRGDRVYSGGARAQRIDRAYSGGPRTQRVDRAYSGGPRAQRGDRVYPGGERRYKGDGGRTWSGGNDRIYRGDRTYRGDRWSSGGRRHVVNRTIYRNAPRYRRSVSTYYYGDPYCRTPVVYTYPRPRTYVSFGIGLGLPYYCPPTYRYRVSQPIVEHYDISIDVDNYPPAGCYYYDPFCEREFENLDVYTDHIDHEGHEHTVEIIERDSGSYVRTLEFVGGYWSVRK